MQNIQQVHDKIIMDPNYPIMGMGYNTRNP